MFYSKEIFIKSLIIGHTTMWLCQKQLLAWKCKQKYMKTNQHSALSKVSIVLTATISMNGVHTLDEHKNILYYINPEFMTK